MAETTISLDEIWTEAAKKFHEICGQSLLKGDVKNFDDVRKKIENVNKQPYGGDDNQEEKWDKAKSVGLKSLKYMKMLLGAAAQASTFIPIPSAAANMAGSALSFVFTVPEKIKGYNNAVDSVFTDISSALAQFHIYKSIDGMQHPLLVQQIHLVMVSIVRLCAHVVKYRQGCRLHRLKRQLASIFDDNQPLEAEMSDFRRVLQAQRHVEGTVTLSVLIETQSDVAQILENSVAFGKTLEETHQGVQALKDDNDRAKTLIKIRDALQVPPTELTEARSTQTCTNIAAKCLPETGSWIWTEGAYVSWTDGTFKADEHRVSNILLILGPSTSGKTLATALIVKRLEEEKGRTYVAHYFFSSAGSKKTEEDNKSPVQSALRNMAFQIARVDDTVRKALSKSCDSENSSVLTRNLNSSLDRLWSELKIGVPGLGAIYYLVFDGVENLGEKDREMLLRFVFGSKLSGDSSGRVRVLVSGIKKMFEGINTAQNALQIDMEQYNDADMRLFIEDRLNNNKPPLLRHVKPGSAQEKARDNVLTRLPRKAAGSYSQLQFALDEVVRLLSSRTSVDELDKLLDHAMDSHQTAIKALQRSLTLEEVAEVNELLKWVHFAKEKMLVSELEAAMLLYTGKESIGLLEDIVTSKYVAVLKISDAPEGRIVEGQEGAFEYLQKEKEHRAQHDKDKSTISMTINITNVDQEVVGHFLWDLSQKAIRDKFRFDFDNASNTLHTQQSTIAVDEFEAHHTLVMRAFKYFSREPSEGTSMIGRYLWWWLPCHMERINQLESDEKGYLTMDEQIDIGRYLYNLFKDQELFKRHKATVENTVWTAEEMGFVQKWLRTTTVTRRVPKKWRDEVMEASSPVRGYFNQFAKMIIENWLRSTEHQSGETQCSYRAWIREFMEADEKPAQKPAPQSPTPGLNRRTTTGLSSPSPTTNETDWEHVSVWCRDFLELTESELDSRWWACIAQAARDETSDNPELVLSLFKRALEKPSPSWICHSNLADCLGQMNSIQEAIAELELTLKEMECESCSPTPREVDRMDVRFRLGELHRRAGNIEQAEEQFSLVSKSSDVHWAQKGQVTNMKAILDSDDAEQVREMLRGALAKDGSEESMVRVLKMIARDQDHNDTIPKIFTIAKGDHDLLGEVVAAIEKATEAPARSEDDESATDISDQDRFAEQEARGVLFYHRGVMLASPDDTKSANNSLGFWQQCREQLSTIGSYVASTTRTNATAELAKYYFHNLMNDHGLSEHMVKALTKLADEDSSLEAGDPCSFLPSLYALRDDKAKAKGLLSRRIKTALEILADDQPDNDHIGYATLFKCLGYYRDFKNSAAALTLIGVPDLLTNALQFTLDELIDEERVNRAQVIELAEEISKNVVQAVKIAVPDSSQQNKRIEVAKEQVQSLITEADLDNNKAKATAIGLINSHITALQKMEPSPMEKTFEQWPWGWFCDGPESLGTTCSKRCDFDNAFVHCLYCSNCDFCQDCFQKLREGSNRTRKCSAEHAWIKMPRLGSDFWRGFNAKTIRVPVVRPVDGDESLWEACYDDDVDGETQEEVTVEAWKAGLAKEWEIMLQN